MLVLSRKVNERIKIGDDIELTVVAISGDTIRLGIEAPSKVRILRSEVYAEVQRQNQESLTTAQIPDELQRLIKDKARGAFQE